MERTEKHYNDRMEVWSRRIARESRALDEQEWMRKVQRDDPELGFFGRQTVFHMVRLHNQMLPLGRSARTKESMEEKSTEQKRRTKAERTCTESRPVQGRFHQHRVLPKPATATITRPVFIEAEPELRRVTTGDEVNIRLPSPPEQCDDDAAVAKVEEPGDRVEVISSTQSEIKADVMWAADKSVSPNLLMDASTMHFSALEVSAIPSNFVADEAGTVIPGITGPDDLGTEVPEFLRSSDALRDSCFTFDLEFINEVCSYDI